VDHERHPRFGVDGREGRRRGASQRDSEEDDSKAAHEGIMFAELEWIVNGELVPAHFNCLKAVIN
jgi:hypothetical protein